MRLKNSILFSFISILSLLILSQETVASLKAAPKAEKEWTFLVFLNGFNNLDRFGDMDINEMETVGSTDQVNVVVQWASYSRRAVKRVYVQKDNKPNEITSPIVQDLGVVDMGDYRTLVEFVRWAKEKYPAKKYFIDVWNHGSGWHRKVLSGGVSSRDISYDDISNNHITTEQLGQAMRESALILGKKVSIYGSDACLMQMMEVNAEMKDAVEVAIGSQHLEPGAGWPYDALLERWNAIPKASARDVAKALTDEYEKEFSGDTEIALSSVDLSQHDRVSSLIRDLGIQIKGLPVSARQKIQSISTETTSLYYSDYKDVGEFARLIEGANDELKISPQLIKELKDAVASFVISNDVSSDLSGLTGIGFWLPESEWNMSSYKDRYKNLVFNQDTQWVDAIESLFASSR